MAEDLDFVVRFAMTKDFRIRSRNVFVEGTTDVELFQLAASLEKERSQVELLEPKLAIIAAGAKDAGGATGVCRELVTFKNMASNCLLSDGRPKYRFAGLFDNDAAGRQAIHNVRRTDTSILEFKDVFCLCPVMPITPNRDPASLQRRFAADNSSYIGLDWELEDLLSEDLIECFTEEFPNALLRSRVAHDKTHREWTSDGKARLHRFAKQYAVYSDLIQVIDVLRALRYYLGIRCTEDIPPPTQHRYGA